MKNKAFRITILAAFAMCGSTYGGVVTYSDAASFDAATSGLSTQSFGFLSPNITSSSYAYNGNPLNSSTNNSPFVTPGDILPGISFSTNSYQGPDIILVGPNYEGLALSGYGVMANFNNSSFDISLSPGVTAFSLNAFNLYGGEDGTVSLYDSSSDLLGSYDLGVISRSGMATFFGATTDSGDIATIVLAAPGFVGFAQAQFGSAGPSTPEPATWMLLGSALLVLPLRKRQLRSLRISSSRSLMRFSTPRSVG